MMNVTTGEFRMLTPSDSLSPAVDEVLLHGTEDQIRRISNAIKSLDADEKRKAKRKAQKAARKRNR